MTLIKSLPVCKYRYGRTEIIESEDGKKKTARIIICCGYREIDAEECIMCMGYSDVKFEFKVESFIKLTKDLRYKQKKKTSIN